MKILFIGMGSIGQRHIQNIKFLFGKDLEFFSVRTSNHNLLIKDGIAKPVKDLNDYYDIKEVFKNLDDALKKFKFDAVFITNPSSMHAKTILRCLDFNTNIFVEKPMCVNYEEALRINNKLRKCDCILYIAYQSRFDPIFKKTKEIITNNKLGSILSARFEWCTFLPDHHKYEDYRYGYAARKDLGGGVLLGLSHELDIILNLFGYPNSIDAIESKSRKINIEADDTVMALCKYSNKLKKFPLSIILSYSQVYETRNFRIQFDNGFIDCNWCTRKMIIVDRKKTKRTEIFHSKINRNDVFKLQTSYFFDCIKKKDFSINNIESSLNIMKLIKNIRINLKRDNKGI